MRDKTKFLTGLHRIKQFIKTSNVTRRVTVRDLSIFKKIPSESPPGKLTQQYRPALGICAGWNFVRLLLESFFTLIHRFQRASSAENLKQKQKCRFNGKKFFPVHGNTFLLLLE